MRRGEVIRVPGCHCEQRRVEHLGKKCVTSGTTSNCLWVTLTRAM